MFERIRKALNRRVEGGVPPQGGSSPLRIGDRSLPGTEALAALERTMGPSAQLSLPIVAGAVNYVGAKLEQAKPRVHREFADGGERLMDGHPALMLWESPNSDMNGSDLTKAVGIQAWLYERAYVRIYVDRASGLPYALHPFFHEFVLPRHVRGSGRAVDYYEVVTDVGYVKVPREEMIEVRFGVNPMDPYRGFDTLRTTGTDAYAVRNIARQAAALTGGMANTSGILIPKNEMTREEVAESREALGDFRVDGGRPGDLMVFNQDADVEQLGFEPAKLALEEQSVMAESHIVSALRVHPSVMYLLSGLKYDNTRGGRQESRKESFTELIIPLWETIADALTEQLLPRWPLPRGTARWGYDHSHIDELVAGDSERFERWGRLYERGGCTLNEMRRGVGLTRVDEEGADDIPERSATMGGMEGASNDREL